MFAMGGDGGSEASLLQITSGFYIASNRQYSLFGKRHITVRPPRSILQALSSGRPWRMYVCMHLPSPPRTLNCPHSSPTDPLRPPYDTRARVQLNAIDKYIKMKGRRPRRREAARVIASMPF
jgi:hypothetical protein